MLRCYQCGKETEPRFPGALRALCPECAAAAGGHLAPPPVTAAAPEPAPTAAITVSGPATRPTVTYALVGLNCLILLAMVATGISPINPEAKQLVDWGANFGLMTLGGQWWRLLSSMFLHLGMIHLAFNMWCLWSLGRLGERLMSHGSFLALYLLSGLGGSVLSVAWHPLVISVGASGAIFGLAGGLGALFYLKKVPAPKEAIKKTQASIASFVLYNLAFGVMATGIDMAAHVGGLVTGAALGAALVAREQTPALRVLRFPAVAACLVALAGGGVLAQRVQKPITDLGEAERLMDRGETAKATQMLEQIVAQRPQFAAAHYLLGNAYLHSSLNGKAQAEYVKAIGLDSDNLAYKLNLGVAYLRMDEPSQAMPLFNEVLAKEPENYAAQLDLAIAQLELKQYDKALAAIDKALAMKPNDAKAYYVRGDAFLGKEDADQAITAFRRSVALDPSYASPQDGLCRAYWQKKDLQQAIACYQDFLKKHPDSETAQKNLNILSARSRGGSNAGLPSKP